MSDRWVFWDFDGTLAHRSQRWSVCVAGIAAEHFPDAGVSPEQVRPLLSAGFPWHTPEQTHHHLTTADEW